MPHTPGPSRVQRDEGALTPPHVGLLRRRWIWVVYALLFAASIPWYLPEGSAPRIWLGLPHWVVLSLAATLGVAVFTAYVIRRHWSDEEPAEETSERSGEA